MHACTTCCPLQLTPGLMASWGAFMGRVTAALAGFDRPSLHRHAYHPWHLPDAAQTIRRHLPNLTTVFDEAQR